VLKGEQGGKGTNGRAIAIKHYRRLVQGGRKRGQVDKSGKRVTKKRAGSKPISFGNKPGGGLMGGKYLSLTTRERKKNGAKGGGKKENKEMTEEPLAVKGLGPL